jgi:hypothetical protein
LAQVGRYGQRIAGAAQERQLAATRQLAFSVSVIATRHRGVLASGFLAVSIATISTWRLSAWDARHAIALCLVLPFLALSGCTSTDRLGGQPDQSPPPPAVPPPPTLTPPPVVLAGKWRLSVAGSSACTMTFGVSTGASDGSIAPAGGCPGNFFTSRKWSYESDKLVIRNHKGEVLTQLSFTNGHFEGQAAAGAVTLAR